MLASCVYLGRGEGKYGKGASQRTDQVMDPEPCVRKTK